MKYVLRILLASTLILTSCSSDDTDDTVVMMENPMDSSVTANQQTAINYFTDVALGFEFGNASEITRKWTTNIVINVKGEPNAMHLAELSDIISDLNALQSTITLRIGNEGDATNFNVFFGSGNNYANENPNAAPFVDANFGLFFVNLGANNTITFGDMYVDIFRATPVKQLHLLREELTQSLGLAKDSPRFRDSIFNDDYDVGCATEYSDIDETIIQLLYDNRVPRGLNETEIRVVLENIIADYIN